MADLVTLTPYKKAESKKDITIRQLKKKNEELEKENNNLLDIINNQDVKIADLEKENAELKAKNKWYSEQVCNKECAEVWGNLTKAKEIIKRLLSCCRNYPQENAEKMEQAEQFLKEIEK